MQELEHVIFDGNLSFEDRCMKVFEYQVNQVEVYKRFCEALGISKPENPEEIPLLPLQAFKDTRVLKNDFASNLHFKSSGTSGMQRSTHFIRNPDVYKQSIIHGMRQFYELDDFVIWAYTPGYNDNPDSSLVWMLQALISQDSTGFSRFLDLNTPLDTVALKKINASGKRLMLFGAAFGLIDLSEKHPTPLPNGSVIMETGGMKTHKREITRSELHHKLASSFDLPVGNIHSEYGMTELLSQSYSLGDEWFVSPHWMKVTIRNPENPLEILPAGEEGLIGIIDMANLYSCSFLLTGDKGIADDAGRFQVLGRWSTYNLRGCNFLIDQD